MSVFTRLYIHSPWSLDIADHTNMWAMLSHTALSHIGETDEANCSWLHPVWPPPKRPDQDSTFCAVSRASTELIFCIHRYFDARNNVCKPRRLVCEYCRDISAWKSRVMKPTVLGDEANCWGALRRMKPTEYVWSQFYICDELQSIAFGCLLSYNIWL